MDISKIITDGNTSSVEALKLFDKLDCADTDFMIGSWQGSGLHTDHPMDGFLEAYQWHGKRFETIDAVHPLVFTRANGKHVNINPLFMLPEIGLLGRGALPKSRIARQLFSLCMPIFSTSRSRARLRMIEHRGKSSATMVYDNLPILDVFRKVDADTVLGLMDLKGMQQPFFFVLRREPSKD